MWKKKIISCSYGVLIIVLCATVVFLIDYILIDRKVRESRLVSTKHTDSANSNTVINSSDSRFGVYAANLKEQRQAFFDEQSAYKTYVYADNLDDVKFYFVELTKEGELSVSFAVDGKDYDTRVIASNVLNYFILNYGNGGFKGVYIVFEDGTTGFVGVEHSYLNGEEITVTKKENLKNIISIVQGSFSDGISGSSGAIYIDIDGNIYK